MCLLIDFRSLPKYALLLHSETEAMPFDRVKRTLSIQEAVYDRVIDKPKTEGSIRVMPLGEEAVAMLELWFEAVSRKAADDFIFSTRDSKPKEPRQILRDYIVPACDELKLRRTG